MFIEFTHKRLREIVQWIFHRFPVNGSFSGGELSFWRAPDAPFGSSLVGETGVEHVDSGMLRDAAFGKQNRGQNGAFMPDGERGSGLGDRWHGGEVAEVG
jgi:hypothetical protein